MKVYCNRVLYLAYSTVISIIVSFYSVVLENPRFSARQGTSITVIMSRLFKRYPLGFVIA